MDASRTLDQVMAWKKAPQVRPSLSTAKSAAIALADRVEQLEQQMNWMRKLVIGRQVLLLRGNPDRGPETGAGFGRRVLAVIEDVPVGQWEVTCRLLEDDPGAVGTPCRSGESGHWSFNQIEIA